MGEAASGLAAALDRAATGVADALTGASAGWLALGVLVHLANQLARAQGWHALLHAAGDRVGRREVLGAWVAGAGAGGVLSSRGGDATRVLLMSRRPVAPGAQERAGAPLVTGTIVAEAAGEAAVGAGLLVLAVAVGVGPALAVPDDAPAILAAIVALAVLAVLLLRRRRSRAPAAAPRRWPRARRAVAGLGRGCVLLRRPGRYARTVLPWQLASRALRAAAIGCFLLAFGLPAAPAVILLVMVAQGGGRILPFAPASVGATVAVVAAGFGPLTGETASAAQVTAFLVGMSTLLTVVGVVLTAVIVARSADPRALLGAVVAAARARTAPVARPAPAADPAA